MSFTVIFFRFRFALPLLLGLVVADDFDGVVVGCRKDVPVVEEGVFLFADIDEGGLQAWFEILDAALEDGADFAGFAGAFDFEFFEDAIFEQSDALFEWLGVDDELGVGLLLALDRLSDAGDERLLLFALWPRRPLVRGCRCARPFFYRGAEVSSSVNCSSLLVSVCFGSGFLHWSWFPVCWSGVPKLRLLRSTDWCETMCRYRNHVKSFRYR